MFQTTNQLLCSSPQKKLLYGFQSQRKASTPSAGLEPKRTKMASQSRNPTPQPAEVVDVWWKNPWFWMVSFGAQQRRLTPIRIQFHTDWYARNVWPIGPIMKMCHRTKSNSVGMGSAWRFVAIQRIGIVARGFVHREPLNFTGASSCSPLF